MKDNNELSLDELDKVFSYPASHDEMEKKGMINKDDTMYRKTRELSEEELDDMFSYNDEEKLNGKEIKIGKK